MRIPSGQSKVSLRVSGSAVQVTVMPANSSDPFMTAENATGHACHPDRPEWATHFGERCYRCAHEYSYDYGGDDSKAYERRELSEPQARRLEDSNYGCGDDVGRGAGPIDSGGLPRRASRNSLP